MFGRNGNKPEIVPTVDEAIYAMGRAADRVRVMQEEVELAFTEWVQAQMALEAKHIKVEFQFGPTLDAAWKTWRTLALQETGEIPLPVGWPGE